MKLELDHTLPQPFYLQIADQIQALIRSGELAAGQRLPTVRSLGEELGVNFNTVARAYRYLDRMGWIIARQGRGAFVQAAPLRTSDQDAREESLRRYIDNFIHMGRGMGFEDNELRFALERGLTAREDTSPGDKRLVERKTAGQERSPSNR